MRLMILPLLLFTLLSTFTHDALAALTVVDKKLTFRTIDVHNEVMGVAVMRVMFSEDVYLGGQLLSNYTGISGGGENKMPEISMSAAGTVRFTCGSGFIRESYSASQQQGPPDFLMVAPTTPEPSVSFTSLLGGSAINEQWNKTEFSAIMIYSTNFASQAAFLACSPTLIFPGSLHATFNPVPGKQITSNTSVVFTGSVTFTEAAEEVCTGEGFGQFVVDLNEYQKQSHEATTQEEFENMKFLSASVTGRAAWNVCRDKIKSMVTYTTVAQVLQNVKSCVHPFGTFSFAADPCCNRTLLAKQCCAPHGVTIQVPLATGTQNTATCQHEAEVQSLLMDFATANSRSEASSAVASTRNGQEEIWKTYTEFIDKCHTKIFQQSCKENSDCMYSGICNSHSGFCQVDWASQNTTLIKCFVRDAPEDISFEWHRMWNIQYSTDPDVRFPRLLPEFASRAQSFDCVGPNAWEFQRRWNESSRAFGASNQAGCLAKQGCNSDPWSLTTQTQCLARQSTFCGQYDGFANRDLSQFGQWNSTTECDKGICSMRQYQFQPVEPSQCTGGITCSMPCSGCRTWRPRQTLCYSVVANSGACSSLGGQFHAQGSICELNNCDGASQFNCSSQTIDTCSTSSLGLANQCQWDDHSECLTQPECEAQGQCTDYELQHCTWIPDQPGVCSNSACVFAPEYDEYANRKQCSNSMQWSIMGCINRGLTTSSACVSAGGSWHTRATSQSECLAHGSACDLTGRGNWDYKFLTDASSCTSCGGVLRPLYEWKTGVASVPRILPTVWTDRAWSSVNLYQWTLDWEKLHRQIVEPAISAIIGRQSNNRFTAKYSRPIPVMQAIICACFSNEPNCLIKYNATVLDEECRQDPGKTTTCGSITYTSTDTSRPSEEIKAYAVLPTVYKLQIQNGTSIVSARRRLLSHTTNTDLVQNTDGVTVGTIVGTGSVLTSVNGSTATICLTQTSFPGHCDFTVPDFVLFIGDVEHAPPLQWNLTSPSTNVYCYANVTSIGVYFLAVRASTPTTYVSRSCTSSSSYMLEAWQIALIAVGSFLFVVIICIVFGLRCAVYVQLLKRHHPSYSNLNKRVKI